MSRISDPTAIARCSPAATLQTILEIGSIADIIFSNFSTDHESVLAMISLARAGLLGPSSEAIPRLHRHWRAILPANALRAPNAAQSISQLRAVALEAGIGGTRKKADLLQRLPLVPPMLYRLFKESKKKADSAAYEAHWKSIIGPLNAEDDIDDVAVLEETRMDLSLAMRAPYNLPWSLVHKLKSRVKAPSPVNTGTMVFVSVKSVAKLALHYHGEALGPNSIQTIEAAAAHAATVLEEQKAVVADVKKRLENSSFKNFWKPVDQRVSEFRRMARYMGWCVYPPNKPYKLDGDHQGHHVSIAYADQRWNASYGSEFSVERVMHAITEAEWYSNIANLDYCQDLEHGSSLFSRADRKRIRAARRERREYVEDLVGDLGLEEVLKLPGLPRDARNNAFEVAALRVVSHSNNFSVLEEEGFSGDNQYILDLSKHDQKAYQEALEAAFQAKEAWEDIKSCNGAPELVKKILAAWDSGEFYRLLTTGKLNKYMFKNMPTDPAARALVYLIQEEVQEGFWAHLPRQMYDQPPCPLCGCRQWPEQSTTGLDEGDEGVSVFKHHVKGCMETS